MKIKKTKSFLYIVMSVTTIIIILIYFFLNSIRDSRRDPIKIIEKTYGLDLEQFDCTVELFDQEIYSGQGSYCKIILKMDSYPEGSDLYLEFKKLKPVPIVIDPVVGVSTIFDLNKYIDTKRGYYLYDIKGRRHDNYDFVLFDLDKNKIIYLHQSI